MHFFVDHHSIFLFFFSLSTSGGLRRFRPVPTAPDKIPLILRQGIYGNPEDDMPYHTKTPPHANQSEQ